MLSSHVQSASHVLHHLQPADKINVSTSSVNTADVCRCLDKSLAS